MTWRSAAAMSGVLTWLTPDELAEFGAELAELLQKHVDRIGHPDRRPPGARPVRLFGIGFPVLELDPDDPDAVDRAEAIDDPERQENPDATSWIASDVP